MSSSVFFRFKSQKEPSRITFDGTGISVFELKRGIISQTKLGDGSDFELVINSEDTGEEYDDDTTIVPRSTTVIAKRLPASKPGKGGAARYVSGKMPVLAKASHGSTALSTKKSTLVTDKGLSIVQSAQSEEERMAAIQQLGADDWARQQQQMAQATPIHRAGQAKGKLLNVPDHPPPAGYVCYRCGEKGHWIMQCPTNDDPSFDGRPRIKRTTGIPKSFLKTIDRPSAPSKDINVEEAKQPASVMVNSEGDWVVAEPDQAAWNKYRSQASTSVANSRDHPPYVDEVYKRGLQCPIDKRLFVDAAKTPCCGTTYCRDCIQNALIENDLRCPSCSTPDIPIDNLTADDAKAAQVRQYETEIAAQQKDLRSQQDVGVRSQHDANEETAEKAGHGKKRPASAEAPSPMRSKGMKVDIIDKPSVKTAKDLNREEVEARNTPPVEEPQSRSAPYKARDLADSHFLQSHQNWMAPNTSMMMPPAAFLGNDWNSTWPVPFPFQQNIMGAANAQNWPMLNTVVPSQDGTQYLQSNNNVPEHSNLRSAQGKQGFSNQQGLQNEEESAYFRRPINSNRQQNRRNWAQNRPPDYHEV